MKLGFTKCFLAAALPCLLWASTPYADNPPQMKMSTPIAPGIMVPDKVKTSIGSLNLNYG